jgi:hypothetical protein
MRFWIAGTCSAGISTPRSPRATMTASVTARISSRLIDRRRLLQLGDDAGTALDELCLDDVLRRAARRRARPSRRPASGRSRGRLAVLLGHRRQRQHHARHVHALAIGQRAAVDDARLGEVRPEALHPQSQLAVVEQQLGAGLERGEDLGVRQRCAMRRPACRGRGRGGTFAPSTSFTAPRRRCRRAASAPAGRAARRSAGRCRARPLRIRSSRCW